MVQQLTALQLPLLLPLPKELQCQRKTNGFENTKGDLAERMLAALEAAEQEGGDLRGKQSAALLVVSGTPTGDPWKDMHNEIG